MRCRRPSTFGPVIRALLSQIAGNPMLAATRSGRPSSRAAGTRSGRSSIAGSPGATSAGMRDADVATELLVGPVYFRLMFGGELTPAFADHVADTVYRGFARRSRRSR